MSTSECRTVNANTDVLGIGIRINFYSTMLLLALIPKRPNTKELLNALYANAGIAGLGLLLTAIIQTAQNQLSLFHALFILHILFFLGSGASPMGKYHWTKSRVIMGMFVQFASVIAFTAWGLYFWVHVKDYGSQPECNDKIKYVVLFFTVRATAPWLRGVWIAVLVLSAVGLMINFGWRATILFAMQGAEEEERAEEMNTVTRRSTRTGTQSRAETEVDTPTVVKPWYFDISISYLLSAIYSTVMLELTVRRNTAKILPDKTNIGPGVVQVDESWVFGQVLAVVMIIASVNEVVHFLFDFFARNRRRLARGPLNQAREEGAANQTEGHSATVEYRPRGPNRSSTSTRDGSPDKISSGYELHSLENRNAPISETVRGLDNTQSHDQSVGTLR